MIDLMHMCAGNQRARAWVQILNIPTPEGRRRIIRSLL